MGRGRTVSPKTLQRRAKMLEWLKADPTLNINQLMKRAEKEFNVRLSFALCKGVHQEATAQRESKAATPQAKRTSFEERAANNGNGHAANVPIVPATASPSFTMTFGGLGDILKQSEPSLPVWKVRAWQEVNAALAVVPPSGVNPEE